MRNLLLFLLIGVLVITVYAEVVPPPIDTWTNFAEWLVFPLLILVPSAAFA